MHWQDEGYLLHKRNFSENSIIIETLTKNHGKYVGVVYGGSSRKQKKNFQIGNKILLNWKSKGENRLGYFNIELIKPVSPFFFGDKKKSICILAASLILKILLPENQVNKKIYESFSKLISDMNSENWIKLYIYWELSLINELGYEIDFFDTSNSNQTLNNMITLNEKTFKIPKFFKNNEITITNAIIKEALLFNKNLFLENFILPNKLKIPFSRNILEKYYN